MGPAIRINSNVFIVTEFSGAIITDRVQCLLLTFDTWGIFIGDPLYDWVLNLCFPGRHCVTLLCAAFLKL